jgi:nucleoside-diphosphate-sugar epimerase
MTGYAQEALLVNPVNKIVEGPAFTPAHLKGMIIDAHDPFKLDFVVARGDEPVFGSDKNAEYTRMIKYFLAALTIPDHDQWVNLSPYEKDRIIPGNFGLTEMGRDLLAQDHLLKQISSALIDPGTALGKEFWDKVYEEAYQRFGTTQVPVDTFQKVWIMPDRAVIYENGNKVYVLEHHLKVMLDSDYVAVRHSEPQSGEESQRSLGRVEEVSQNNTGDPSRLSAVQDDVMDIMREVIIPVIEKNVNEGKDFARLRQIYSSMLLATWFKRAMRSSVLATSYGDRSKVKGIDQDPVNNQRVYDRYVDAFKQGAFNMIREDVDKYTHESIPRKFFSGGMVDCSQEFERGQVKVIHDIPDEIKADMAQKNDVVRIRLDKVIKPVIPSKINYGLTGAEGFVGTQALRYLLRQEDTGDVYVLSRKTGNALTEEKLLLRDKRFSGRIHVVKGDLGDVDALGGLIRNSDVVLHLGGWAGKGERTMSEAVRDNVVATRLIRILAQRWNKRLIFVSTVQVYDLGVKRSGLVERGFIKEEDLVLNKGMRSKVEAISREADRVARNLLFKKKAPAGIRLNEEPLAIKYALTKYAAEKEALRYPNAMVLRASNVYGPGDIKKRLIPILVLKKKFENEKELVFPSKSRWNSFIYVDDLTDALYRAAKLKNFHAQDRVINVAHPFLLSPKLVSLAVMQALGAPWDNEMKEQAREQILFKKGLGYDVGKMQSVLGFDVDDFTSFKKGLAKTVEWFDLLPMDRWRWKDSDDSQVGGIDFNAAHIKIEVRHDGHRPFAMIDPDKWGVVHFDGLAPVILDIKPAVAAMMFDVTGG